MFKTRFTAIVTGAAACALIIVAASGSFAQEYKGSKACRMCHGMMHKPIVEGYDKLAHPKALREAEKAPETIVATFDDNAPFKKADVKLVLGSGRTGQAYIGADMQTLPAKWDVKAKKWNAIPVVDAKTQCIGCHVTGYDAVNATWVEEGVTCESCHGPGSGHSSGDKTKIINPKNLSADKADMICGSCHSAGTNTAKTHAFPTEFKPAGDLAACFVDAQPKTAGQNQQYSEHKQSKHAANGVKCVTCHEPHGVGVNQPHQLKKPINELCLSCHGTMDMASHAPSAPAGATCATCHMPNGSHNFAKAGT